MPKLESNASDQSGRPLGLLPLALLPDPSQAHFYNLHVNRPSLKEPGEAEESMECASLTCASRTVMDTWCEMNLSIVAVDVAVFV